MCYIFLKVMFLTPEQSSTLSVGLVYIAVVGDDFSEVKEYRFRGTRIDIKNYSANTALNMIRLKLIKIAN